MKSSDAMGRESQDSNSKTARNSNTPEPRTEEIMGEKQGVMKMNNKENAM